MMKNYIGIIRDHSGSMSSLQAAAAKDYNSVISGIREGAVREGIDTIVTVVRCGVGYEGLIDFEVRNSSISAIKELAAREYRVDGGYTPLIESVGRAIEEMEKVPDAKDPGVSFLIEATTDGLDNPGRRYLWDTSRLAAKIRELQATDRWTFLFRVPKGQSQTLSRQLGIPIGNFYEWDQTEYGVRESTEATNRGFSDYYSNLSKGVKSTQKFFVDMANITTKDVEQNLIDISNSVTIWSVLTEIEGKAGIRDFCESKLRAISNGKMLRGAAFYELLKSETVQDGKLIIIRDKSSGKVYHGNAARSMLGLPQYGAMKIAPSSFGQYEVYVQSKSTNRVLPVNSKVLYWPDVGTVYKEGRSAA